MDQNRRSVLTTLFEGNDGFRDQIDRNQLFAFVAVLVGSSQLLLASVAFPLSDSLSFFVVSAGGMTLIAIGISLFRGKKAFKSGWESERMTWLSTVMVSLFAIDVAAAAVSVAFGVAWLRTVVVLLSIILIGDMFVTLIWQLFRNTSRTD